MTKPLYVWPTLLVPRAHALQTRNVLDARRRVVGRYGAN